MTHDELLTLLKYPDSIEEKYLPHLKDIMLMHPYFSTTRLIHAKSLVETKDIQLSSVIKISNLYTASRSWFYYYLYPDRLLSTGKYRKEKAGKSSGDYFDMIDALESQGANNKNTLKSLAERLKSARNMVSQAPQIISNELRPPMVVNDLIPLVGITKELNINLLQKTNLENPKVDDLHISLEAKSKILISERKYTEAIEILKRLNLNNPKKSVYFADQIRFLEKIIANTQK